MSKRYACPQVLAAQNEKEPLEHLQMLFGGEIALSRHKARASKAEHWYWQLNGAQGAGLMMTLYSLMGARRKSQIADVLTRWRAAPQRPARIVYA